MLGNSQKKFYEFEPKKTNYSYKNFIIVEGVPKCAKYSSTFLFQTYKME